MGGHVATSHLQRVVLWLLAPKVGGDEGIDGVRKDKKWPKLSSRPQAESPAVDTTRDSCLVAPCQEPGSGTWAGWAPTYCCVTGGRGNRCLSLGPFPHLLPT